MTGTEAVAGSVESDAHIDAMLGSPRTTPAEARPAQSFRRVSVDEALGMLRTARE